MLVFFIYKNNVGFIIIIIYTFVCNIYFCGVINLGIREISSVINAASGFTSAFKHEQNF